MPTTYIIGHRKPDTDSVVAAMALEFLYQQVPGYGYNNAQAAVVDPFNPETRYLFDRYNLQAPQQLKAEDLAPDDRVVLVDHNEESQRLPGLDQEQIIEILDHHKANLNLNKPIYLTFKTWGSSTSIVYYLMRLEDLKPDSKLAALMLAAILSDTVGYKSATTTARDKKYGVELAKIAGINDVEQFTLDIFKAKSNVADLTAEQIVRNDFKIFEFVKKTYIGQLETVEQDEILAKRKAELLQAMAQVKQQEEVELLFLVITDVLKVNSKILVLGDQEQAVLTKAFPAKTEDQIMDIGPKLSRKKEIAPEIEKALSTND